MSVGEVDAAGWTRSEYHGYPYRDDNSRNAVSGAGAFEVRRNSVPGDPHEVVPGVAVLRELGAAPGRERRKPWRLEWPQ